MKLKYKEQNCLIIKLSFYIIKLNMCSCSHFWGRKSILGCLILKILFRKSCCILNTLTKINCWMPCKITLSMLSTNSILSTNFQQARQCYISDEKIITWPTHPYWFISCIFQFGSTRFNLTQNKNAINFFYSIKQIITALKSF